jgi:hypothetical protein
MYFLNKLSILFTLKLVFCTLITGAQHTLVFTNIYNQKTITAQLGSTISVYYKGYLNQIQFTKNTLSAITDSSIILGLMFEPTAAKAISEKPKFYTEILLRDIVAFRKISLGKNLLKTTAQFGAIYGGFFVLQNYIQRDKNTTLQNFGITLGIGLGSTILIKLLFNEKPKYKISKGWQVSVR